MKLFLLGILLLNVSGSFAANKFLKGDGKFIATDDDSHQFITKQLTHEAFRSIITKKLKTLGLSSDLFWQKISDGLELRYAEIDTQLRLKYKMDETPSKSQKTTYKRIFRAKKLKLRRTYGKISNVISRYAVNKISRSQKNKHYRYIKLEGEVNTASLNRLYYKFVRGSKSSDYGSIFLDVDFVLDGVSYSELNIENENDFEDVVIKSWLDWFSKNKPGNIANIEILGEDKKSKLVEYMKLPSEAMLTNIPEFCVNSLLLKVEVKITKTMFDKTLNRFDFKYEGSAFLKDLQTNLNINTFNLSPEMKSYLVTQEVNLANVLANHVYKLALGSFPKMISSIKNLAPISSIQRVSVLNYSNMENLNYLLDQIRSKGIKYSIKAEIENISNERAEFVLYFDGEIAEVKTMLSGLNAAKNDLSFELIDTPNTLGIKFNKAQVIENL
jgi:hypothetical protein